MTDIQSTNINFSYVDLENEVKKEIYIQDLLVYPKNLINFFLRKLHSQQDKITKLDFAQKPLVYEIYNYELDRT